LAIRKSAYATIATRAYPKEAMRKSAYGDEGSSQEKGLPEAAGNASIDDFAGEKTNFAGGKKKKVEKMNFMGEKAAISKTAVSYE